MPSIVNVAAVSHRRSTPHTIQVRVPQGNSSQVRFLAEIQNINVRVSAIDTKVVINSRTGSVVMNRDVILDACAMAQGNLSVVVEQKNTVSQPVVTPNTQISVQQQCGVLQKVNASANLNSVIRALNTLGATPNDLMLILQAMQSAGCLLAKLEII